jgi:aerobic-type carbon monoxide dehydrogenase small subunit (CoxS/CutS family)
MFQTNSYCHHEYRRVKNGYSTFKVDTVVSNKTARKSHSFMAKEVTDREVSTIKGVKGF